MHAHGNVHIQTTEKINLQCKFSVSWKSLVSHRLSLLLISYGKNIYKKKLSRGDFQEIFWVSMISRGY